MNVSAEANEWWNKLPSIKQWQFSGKLGKRYLDFSDILFLYLKNNEEVFSEVEPFEQKKFESFLEHNKKNTSNFTLCTNNKEVLAAYDKLINPNK